MSEYWTMFKYGSVDTICSKHKTLEAARLAASKCEKRGGAKHWIIRAVKIPVKPIFEFICSLENAKIIEEEMNKYHKK